VNNVVLKHIKFSGKHSYSSSGIQLTNKKRAIKQINKNR
jgi:hypothetical protein